MPAPFGTWNINANGNAGTLQLSANNTGGITGTVFGDQITVVWDETSQILSFSRATDPAPDFAFEVYTGTLFQAYTTPNSLIPGEGLPLMLAGTFEQFSTQPFKLVSVGPLPWFAMNQSKLKEKEGKETKESKDKEKDIKDKEKDIKEKEGLIEKVSEVPQGLQSLPQTDMALSAQGGAAPDVRSATGKSFIPPEERPQVGAAALRASPKE